MTPDGPRFDVHPVVFWVSTGLVLAILAASLLAIETVGIFFTWLQSNIAESFGWLYIFSMTGFLVFVVALMVTRMGSIRLGPDDPEPEFSRLTWFAMLFSAGMGIGLLYFGVAEPIMHYSSPPSGRGEDLDAVRNAMSLTFFHWGLHSWAVYSVVGLSLAYFGFRKGLPFSVRSALYPLIGDRIHGWIGNVVDVLAILATLFGIATSLGLGSMQVNAGLNHLMGIEETIGTQVMIIAAITAIATGSVVSGLYVGIRRLSEISMGLAGSLMLFVFVAGPTFFLVSAFVQNVATYFQQLPVNAFWTAEDAGAGE